MHADIIRELNTGLSVNQISFSKLTKVTTINDHVIYPKPTLF